MLLGLMTAALVLGALLWELGRPRVMAVFASVRERADCRARERRVRVEIMRARELDRDPGRDLRAERRARRLLRSCVGAREWEMYRDLGFLRVWASTGDGRASTGDGRAGAGQDHAYLIYPHRPIVAYAPRTGRVLSEHCVVFPDRSRPYGGTRLPDADDVLAKWMALRADEHRLIARANMHLPGRQLDARRVKRDLRRLAAWERERDGVAALDSVRTA